MPINESVRAAYRVYSQNRRAATARSGSGPLHPSIAANLVSTYGPGVLKEALKGAYSYAKDKKKRKRTGGGRVSGAVRNQHAASSTSAGVKKGKQRKNNKKKKGVKVSKKLRLAIKEVAKPYEITGTYTRSIAGYGMDVSPPQADLYRAIVGFNNSSAAIADSSVWSFSHNKFLDAASVLFNGKPVADSTANLAPNATSNFNYQSTEFNVINSYVRYNLRNVTSRTIILKIFDCYPKRVSSADIGGTAHTESALFAWSNANAEVAEPTALVPPNTMLKSSYDNDSNDASYIGTAFTVAGVPSNVSPFILPTMRNWYTNSFKEVVLEGFQSYTHIIQGPKNWKYEGRKHFKANIWQNLSSHACCPLIVAMQDQVQTALTATGLTNGFGRIGSNTTNNNEVAVEMIEHFKISMPPQTDGAAAGGTAGFRRPTYAHFSIAPLVTAASVVNDGSSQNPFATANQ